MLSNLWQVVLFIKAYQGFLKVNYHFKFYNTPHISWLLHAKRRKEFAYLSLKCLDSFFFAGITFREAPHLTFIKL